MKDAFDWVWQVAGNGKPVLVAYPLSFDWSWLYWYFNPFQSRVLLFNYSRCFDVKTAFAIKAHLPIADAGRSRLNLPLRSLRGHTHHALDDAIEQAEIFANIFEWEGEIGELLDQRLRRTAERIKKLQQELTVANQLCGEKVCVYATGSFARGEANDHSELDLFIVGEGTPSEPALAPLDEILIKADLIEVTRNLGIPDFPGAGNF